MEQANTHTRDEQLKRQIAQAGATTPTIEAFEKVLLEGAQLSNAFLQGKITGEELRQQLQALNQDAGVVKTEDPTAFRRILELMSLGEDMIQTFINDEMSHYEKAREQGLKPVLRVQLFKIDDEHWGVHPQTEVLYPAEVADEFFREAHRKTLGAPGEEHLSLLDRKGLGLE